MTAVELNDYMISFGYTREHNTWLKSYDVSDEEKLKGVEGNKLTIVYKLNKQFVNMYQRLRGNSKKVMKAKLKQITIKDDGSLDGFKSLV